MNGERGREVGRKAVERKRGEGEENWKVGSKEIEEMKEEAEKSGRKEKRGG